MCRVRFSHRAQPREIAAQASAFVVGDLTVLLIDHLLPVMPLSDAHELLCDLWWRYSSHACAVFQAAEASILRVLGGVHTPVSESCMRRAFQVRQRGALPGSCGLTTWHVDTCVRRRTAGRSC
jgi:hypothetical protein